MWLNNHGEHSGCTEAWTQWSRPKKPETDPKCMDKCTSVCLADDARMTAELQQQNLIGTLVLERKAHKTRSCSLAEMVLCMEKPHMQMFLCKTRSLSQIVPTLFSGCFPSWSLTSCISSAAWGLCRTLCMHSELYCSPYSNPVVANLSKSIHVACLKKSSHMTLWAGVGKGWGFSYLHQSLLHSKVMLPPVCWGFEREMGHVSF